MEDKFFSLLFYILDLLYSSRIPQTEKKYFRDRVL